MGKQAAIPTLIYLHIPKCAGSSMMPLLRANYGAGFYRVPNGGGWRKFYNLPESVRADITCLTGHMPWGLHALLPGPHKYAVMLRDPVDRVTSLYWFCRQFKGHRWHKQARRFSLAKFSEKRLFSDIDNGMTRWLAGREDVGSLPIQGPVTVNDLRLAMLNLQSMSVGFVETFDQSVSTWAREFRWAHARARRRKQVGNYRRPYKRIRQAVREANALDVELYEWAKGQCAS